MKNNYWNKYKSKFKNKWHFDSSNKKKKIIFILETLKQNIKNYLILLKDQKKKLKFDQLYWMMINIKIVKLMIR